MSGRRYSNLRFSEAPERVCLLCQNPLIKEDMNIKEDGAPLCLVRVSL